MKKKIFTAFLMVIMGLAAGVVGILNLSKARESAGWTETEGEVIASDVDRKGSSSSSNRWRARVRYKYSVNGEVFECDRVDFVKANMSLTKAKERAGQYSAGTQVTVYYDPADPSEAVLENGVKLQVYFMPGIGLVFVVIGIGSLFSRNVSVEVNKAA